MIPELRTADLIYVQVGFRVRAGVRVCFLWYMVWARVWFGFGFGFERKCAIKSERINLTHCKILISTEGVGDRMPATPFQSTWQQTQTKNAGATNHLCRRLLFAVYRTTSALLSYSQAISAYTIEM